MVFNRGVGQSITYRIPERVKVEWGVAAISATYNQGNFGVQLEMSRLQLLHQRLTVQLTYQPSYRLCEH